MRRRRSGRSRPVLRCPRCGSARIVLEAGGITGQFYHCPACDYRGSLVLEVDLPPDGQSTPPGASS